MLSLIGLVSIFFSSVLFAKAGQGTISLLHIVPADPTNHTLSTEIKSFEFGLTFALEDLRRSHPNCKISPEIVLKTGSQEELLAETRRIASRPGNQVLIGFPRSTFARLVAMATQKFSIDGISVGATTEELRVINPRFFSMASPFSEQWRVIEADLKSRCKVESTIGVFDSTDYYSELFRKSFAEKNLGALEDRKKDVGSLLKSLEKMNCAFLGMNMGKSRELVSGLLRSGWQGRLYGTGDWSYYSSELRSVVKTANRKPKIFAPTGWTGEENERAKKFVARFKSKYGRAPEPLVAYTYDATKLAAEKICNGRALGAYSKSLNSELGLLREYAGVGKGGNFLTPFQLRDVAGSD